MRRHRWTRVPWSDGRPRWRSSNTVTSALAGERQLAFVSGEVGIGKTTVVERFLASLAGSQVRISRGQCVEQYGVGEPYLPILKALGHLGQAPGGERVVVALWRYAPMWLVQLTSLVPEVEWEPPLRRRVWGMTRLGMLRESADVMAALTAAMPLVMVLEDLHWSDPATIDMLSYLAQRREPAQLLVLGTYRPEDAVVSDHPVQGLVQELSGRRLCTEVRLQELTAVEVTAYVAGHLGGQVAPALAAWLYHCTEGHPLLLVNMLEHLQQQRRLVRTGAECTLRAEGYTTVIGVPARLQHLVTRRLEALPKPAQRVLEAAAVAGQAFPVAAGAAGLRWPIARIDRVCETVAAQGQFLRAMDLELWPDGTRSARYQFRHALYHQVCYERLGAARRVDLHRQFAARLEAAYGEQARTRAAELAVHYARGLEPTRSLVYCRYAGEAALRQHAYAEAIAHCTAGIDTYTRLTPTPALTAGALALTLTLGATRLATEGFASPAVEQAYSQAYGLAQEVGDTAHLFPALYGLGSFYRVRAEFATAYELMQQLMHVAQGAQDPALLLIAHSALGEMLRYWRDGLGQARWHLEQSLALYDPAQHSILPSRYGLHPQVSCLANLGTLLWQVAIPRKPTSGATTPCDWHRR
jgi:predicted ATPase